MQNTETELKHEKCGIRMKLKFDGVLVSEAVFQSEDEAIAYADKFTHDYYGVMDVSLVKKKPDTASGVTFSKKMKKWQALLMKGTRRSRHQYFNSFEEASKAFSGWCYQHGKKP